MRSRPIASCLVAHTEISSVTFELFVADVFVVIKMFHTDGPYVSVYWYICVAKAQILDGLRDQVVPYKTTLTLSCEVVGVPLPFRSWLKNGRPVSCKAISHFVMMLNSFVNFTRTECVFKALLQVQCEFLVRLVQTRIASCCKL